MFLPKVSHLREVGVSGGGNAQNPRRPPEGMRPSGGESSVWLGTSERGRASGTASSWGELPSTVREGVSHEGKV